MPRSKFVTAWAATQSQMFLVRNINQVTRLNQTAAARSSPGCISMGTAVPMTAAASSECAEGNGPPGFADDEPHEEAAEEELFDDRDDEREAEKADGQE